MKALKVSFVVVAVLLVCSLPDKPVKAAGENRWYIKLAGGPGADHMSWYVIANDKGQDIICMTVGNEPNNGSIDITRAVSCAPFNNPK